MVINIADLMLSWIVTCAWIKIAFPNTEWFVTFGSFLQYIIIYKYLS